MTEKHIFDEIFKRTGSQAELARVCGITAAAVHHWTRRGQIPAEKCRVIEKATGISRKQLRPDIFK